METNEAIVGQLTGWITKEMEELKGAILISPHLWIGRACRSFAPQSPPPDNKHLINLYLREFWFCDET
jgi:hypothetical protein